MVRVRSYYSVWKLPKETKKIVKKYDEYFNNFLYWVSKYIHGIYRYMPKKFLQKSLSYIYGEKLIEKKY